MNFLLKIGIGIPVIIGGFVAAKWFSIVWVACFTAGTCIIEPVKGGGKAGLFLGLTIAPLLLLPGLFINPEAAVTVGGIFAPWALFMMGTVGSPDY